METLDNEEEKYSQERQKRILFSVYLNREYNFYLHSNILEVKSEKEWRGKHHI